MVGFPSLKWHPASPLSHAAPVSLMQHPFLSVRLQEDVPDDAEVTYTDERSRNEELRCVLAVIRHGDRTPKQKLKVGHPVSTLN